MELFIPSVLILLLAAAVIFFVIPRFGAPVLALISVGLLAFGIYQHIQAFGTEYRLSTWQQGLTSYAPYVMIGGLLIVIAFYLITISPLGRPNSTAPNLPEMPSVNEMPSPNTATNAVTAGVNNALKGVGNVAGNLAGAIGLGNANKGNGNNVTKAANNAVAGVGNVFKNAAAGLKNTMNEVKNVVKNTIPTGNVNRGNNSNKGLKVPGLGIPLSQI